MKIKSRLLLIILAFIIVATGCNRNKNQLTNGESIKEDFELPDKPGSKSYRNESFEFKSGTWLLNDALIGMSDKDAKNGIHSIPESTGRPTQSRLSRVVRSLAQHRLLEHRLWATGVSPHLQLLNGRARPAVGDDEWHGIFMS